LAWNVFCNKLPCFVKSKHDNSKRLLKRDGNIGHNADMSDELLTPEAAADYLKMHVDSVRRLLRQRKLPGVKVGGGWRLKKTVLDSFLEGGVTVDNPARKAADVRRGKKPREKASAAKGE
jgi:excisionase family DNA binding protein